MNAVAGVGLRRRWAQLQARERRLLALAAGVVGLALLWWLGLAPAIRVLQTAPQQQALLQQQYRQMQALQREAQELSAQPRRHRAEALQAVRRATQEHLGSDAGLREGGGSVQVTLRNAAPQALASWLADLRSNAGVVPTAASLVRNQGSANAPPGWNGTVELKLPPAGP